MYFVLGGDGFFLSFIFVFVFWAEPELVAWWYSCIWSEAGLSLDQGDC